MFKNLQYTKIIHAFVLTAFLLNQVSAPQGFAENVALDVADPNRSPVISPEDVVISTIPEGSQIPSNDFDASPLSLVEEETGPEVIYDAERYDFEVALDHLRPEYASAVIVKDLNEENFRQLLNLNFEVAVVVLDREIVLFTTGNQSEIGILPAARELLSSAVFVAHTHIADGSEDGPSGFDLTHALAPPLEEYVISQNGIYAYSLGETPQDVEVMSFADMVGSLEQARQNAGENNQVEARQKLNEFIAAMDLYNDALLNDRQAFRLSDALLDSLDVVLGANSAFTNDPNLNVTLTAGLSIPLGENIQFSYSFDNINFTPPENLDFTGSVANAVITIAGNDGVKDIWIRISDTTPEERLIQTSIILDRKPPFNPNSDLYVQQPAPAGQFIFKDNNQYDFADNFVIMGDGLVVGDQGYNNGKGAIFFLESGNVTPILNPSPDYEYFGSDIVVIDEHHIAVGAQRNLSQKGGAVFVYNINQNNGQNEYTLIQTLTSPETMKHDGFGLQLKVSDGLLFVGAPSDSNNVLDEGRVYVFDVDIYSPTFGQCLRTLKVPLGIFPASYSSWFGSVLEISDNKLYVGMPGKNAVSIFEVNRNSPNFGILLGVLQAPAGIEAFARAFALDGSLIVATAKSTADGYVLLVMDGDPSSPTFSQIIKTIKPADPQYLIMTYGESLVQVANGKYFVHAQKSYEAYRQVLIFNGDSQSIDFGKQLQVINGPFNFGREFVATGNTLIVGKPKNPESNGNPGTPGQLYTYLNDSNSGFFINNGEKYTKNLNVNLSLNFEDNFSSVSNLKMAFSQDGINFSHDESFIVTKQLELNDGADGERTLWVRITDEAGNSIILKRSIRLDRQPPEPLPGKQVVEFVQNENHHVTATILNVMDEQASDLSEIEMRQSNDGINFTLFTKNWKRTDQYPFAGDLGDQTLYFQFRDPAGNVSPMYTGAIFVDTVPPTGPIYANGGAPGTNNLEVTLDLSHITDRGSGLGTMQICYQGFFAKSCRDWEPYQKTKSFYIEPFPGMTYVYVEVKDNYGNSTGEKQVYFNAQVPRGFGPLDYVSNGNYELTLGEDFDLLQANLKPADHIAGLGLNDRLNLDYTIFMTDLEQRLADVYDFVLALPSTKALSGHLLSFDPDEYIGAGRPEKFDIEGIGLPENDAEALKLEEKFGALFDEYFSTAFEQLLAEGQQQGTALLNIKAAKIQNHTNDFVDFVLLQLLGHRWGAFLNTRGNLSQDPLGILDPSGSNWSVFFDAGTSPMNGLDWQDNGDGSFTLVKIYGMNVDNFIALITRNISAPQENVFNDFDLYSMGLLAPEDVRPSFVIDAPKLSNGTKLTDANFNLSALFNFKWLTGDRRIKGVRRNITIDDVVRIEGERNPSTETSKKDFSIAFVNVIDATETLYGVDSRRYESEILRQRVSRVWSDATRGLSTLTMGSKSGDFDAFKGRVLNSFDEALISPEHQALIPDLLQRRNENTQKLLSLESLLKETSDRLVVSQSMGGKYPDLILTLNAFSEDLLEIRSEIEVLRARYDSTEPASSNIMSDLLAVDRDELQLQLERSRRTGMLPLEFSSLFDFYMRTLTSAKKIFQELPGWNQDIEKDYQGIYDLLQNVIFRLESLLPVVGPLESNLLTELPNNPVLGVRGGTTSSSSKAKSAKAEIRDFTSQGLSMGYDVVNVDSYAALGIDFINGVGILPQDVTFGLQGPAGASLKIVFKDSDGRQAVYYSQLPNGPKNFTFKLPGIMPNSFDRSKTASIQIIVQNKGSVKTALKGTLAVQLKGFKFPPEKSGEYGLARLSTLEEKGQLLEFYEKIFSLNGSQEYYFVKRNKIKRDKKTGRVTSYTDSIGYIEGKSSIVITYTYKNGQGSYKISGKLKDQTSVGLTINQVETQMGRIFLNPTARIFELYYNQPGNPEYLVMQYDLKGKYLGSKVVPITA